MLVLHACNADPVLLPQEFPWSRPLIDYLSYCGRYHISTVDPVTINGVGGKVTIGDMGRSLLCRRL